MRFWQSLLVLGVLLAPQLCGAIDHNAFHRHERDDGIDLGLRATVGATTTTYDVDIDAGTALEHEEVALDEVHLVLTFKDSEQSIDANRLVAVLFDDGDLTQRRYDRSKFTSAVAGQRLILSYSFTDRSDEDIFRAIRRPPWSLLSSYWKVEVTGDEPLHAAEIYLTFHQLGNTAMPNLYGPASHLEFPPANDRSLLESTLAQVNAECPGGPLLGSVPSGGHDRLVVFVHGWNPSGASVANMYAPGCSNDGRQAPRQDGLEHKWRNLFERISSSRAGTGWTTLRYDWNRDAATGSAISEPVDNPNAARDAAHAHGLKLGILLGRLRPKNVHFIAHSAGSWAARRAAEYLRKHRELGANVVLQMTVLDPFVNDGPSVSDEDFDLSFDFAMTRAWVDHLENYWSNDIICVSERIPYCGPGSTPTDIAGWTSGEFLIDPPWDTQQRLDVAGRTCFQDYMDSHSGPVAWYADTAGDSDTQCLRSTLRDSQLGFAGGSEAARVPRLTFGLESPTTGSVANDATFAASVEADLAQSYSPPSVGVSYSVAGALQTSRDLSSSILPTVDRWTWRTAGRVENGTWTVDAKARGTVFNRRTGQPREISSQASVTVDVANASGGGGTVGVAPDGPTNLRQYDPVSVTQISQGSSVGSNRARMSASVTDRDLEALTLEVEVKPFGIAFDNAQSPTCVAAAGVASGNDAAATCSSLSPGSYHWQARARDARGNAGPWRSPFPSTPGLPDFVVNAPPTGYSEGSAYRNAAGSVCRYMSGACYLLASQDVYLHFYPADTSRTRATLLSTAEYSALVTTSPCQIGGDYWATGAARGCLHIDGTALAPEAPVFVLDAALAGRRVRPGAVGACFDATRVVATPGLAARFTFADSSDAPYYCDPSGSVVETCGACRTRVSGCDAATCRPSPGACQYQCLVTEVCDAGACKDPASTLRAGRVTSPSCGNTIPNAGSPVTWTLGSSTIGVETETALYCHKDGDEWYPVQAYGPATTGSLPGLRPGEAFECKTRTRRSATLSPWAESPVCRWIASSSHAEAAVVATAPQAEPIPNGCNSLEVVATIRNVGDQSGSFTARAWLHPAAGNESSPGALEARRSCSVGVLAPGSQEECRFSFALQAPLTLDPDAVRVTVEARDDAGFGQPARLSAAAFGLDSDPPLVSDLTVYGFPGAPVGVVPGRQHLIVAGAEDRYGLDRSALEWRTRPSGAWQVIRQNTLTTPCRRNDGLSTSWSVPAGIPGGTQLELRATAWDLSGRSVQKSTLVEARSTSVPTARFIAPSGGERYLLRTPETPTSCIPAEIVFVPGEPIQQLSVGHIDANDHAFADLRVTPIPTDGRASVCVPANFAGDHIRLAAIIRDANGTDHVFASEPFMVDFPAPRPPWRRAAVEPTQRLLPPPAGSFSSSGSSMAFTALRALDGELLLSRVDVRDWTTFEQGKTNELSVHRLHVDRQTLAVDASETVLPATNEPGRIGYGVNLVPARYEDDFYYDLDIPFLPPCTDPFAGPRCTFELHVRELLDGTISGWRSIATYPDLLSTPVFEQPRLTSALRAPSGEAMLVVRSGSDASPRTDVFGRAGTSWSLLASHPQALREVLSVGSSVWGLRTVAGSAANPTFVEAVQIDPGTGAIISRRAVMTFGEDQVTWTSAKDPLTDHFVVLGYERTNKLTRVSELVGESWTEHPPRPLAAAWRGKDLTRVEMGSAVLGGGTVYWAMQPYWAGGFEALVVASTPDGAFELESALLDDSPSERLNNRIALQKIAADPNGDLVRMFDCQWNMEQRLCLQQAVPGVRTGCDDGDPCTDDGWDPDVGACVHGTVDCNAEACAEPKACDPATGACVPTGEGLGRCDDGQFCNGTESCDASSGDCLPGDPPTVDDGILCTRDECRDSPPGIGHVADDDFCPADACQVARCAPASADADPVTGCVVTPREAPDDSLDCTTDTCDPATGASVHAPRPGWCVIGRSCVADRTINPDDACQRCDAAREDGSWSPVADGEVCDDAQRCTVADRCVSGRCAGVPRDCADELAATLNSCKRASCDESNGSCVARSLPNGASCADGDLCNGAEVCQAGACRPGSPPNCDDEAVCTIDACDADGVCQNVPTVSCEDDTAPARLTVSNAEVHPGETAHVPIRLEVPRTAKVGTLRFTITVTANGTAPAPSGDLQFAHCLAYPRPAPDVAAPDPESSVTVTWSAPLTPGLSGTVQLGSLVFDVPTDAVPGDRWVMSIADIFATASNGAPLSLQNLTGTATNVGPHGPLVFRADFEANNFCGWSDRTIGEGALKTSKKAALGGRYGLQARVVSGQSIFLQDNRPNGLRHYEARFLLDPNSVALTEGAGFTVLLTKGRGKAKPIALSLHRRDGAYALRLLVRPATGRKKVTRLVPVADSPVEVTVVWHGATTPEASDGWAELFLDAVSAARIAGLNTADHRIEQERFGAFSVTDPTATGSIRLDEFESTGTSGLD